MPIRSLTLMATFVLAMATSTAQVDLDLKAGTWLSSPRFAPGKLAVAEGKAFLFAAPNNEFVSYDLSSGTMTSGVMADSLTLLVSDVPGSHIIGDGNRFLLIAGSDYLHSQNGAIIRSYDAGETWTAARPEGTEDLIFGTGIAQSDAVQLVNDTTVILLGRISRDQGMSFQPIVTDSGDTISYSSRQAFRGYSDGSCTIIDFDRREVLDVKADSNVAVRLALDIMPSFIRSFGEQYQVYVNASKITGVRDRSTGEVTLVRWSENDSLNTLITRSEKTIHTTQTLTVVDVPSYELSAVFAGDRYVVVPLQQRRSTPIGLIETSEEFLLLSVAESGTSVITHVSRDLEQTEVTQEDGCYRYLNGRGTSVKTPIGALYLNPNGVLLNYEREEGLSISLSTHEQSGYYVANVAATDDCILFEDHMSTVIMIDSTGLPRVIEYNADGLARPGNTLHDVHASFLTKSCTIKTTFYVENADGPEMTAALGRYNIARSMLVDEEYFGYMSSLHNNSALYAENDHIVHCSGDEDKCDTLPAEISGATDIHLAGSRMLVERCLTNSSAGGITVHAVNDPATVQSEYGREYTVHTMDRDSEGVIWAVVSNTVFERTCSQPTPSDRIDPGTFVIVVASHGGTWMRVDSVSSGSALLPLSGHVVSSGEDRIIALGTHIATYRYDPSLGAYRKLSNRYPGTSLPRYYDVATWRSLLLVGTDRGLYIDQLVEEPSNVDDENQLVSHERVDLYPNPAGTTVHVRISNIPPSARHGARLLVVSTLGEVVATYVPTFGGSSNCGLEIDVRGIASGPYRVVYTSNGGTLSSSLHVTH